MWLQSQTCVQVVYFTLQMLIGPSELETIAGVNTTNDTLRRALTGQTKSFSTQICVRLPVRLVDVSLTSPSPANSLAVQLKDMFLPYWHWGFAGL